MIKLIFTPPFILVYQQSLMENKVTQKIQDEVDDILHHIQKWENLYDVKTEFFYDGCPTFLREKSVYPRCIILFKSYKNNTYSIKCFEIHLKNYQEEQYKELYSIDNIQKTKNLIKELKNIIYGKDLMLQASKIYNNTFKY